MTSGSRPENLAQTAAEASPPDEDEKIPLGGRATADDIYVIDRAALELGIRRGTLVVGAGIAYAKVVLAQRGLLEQVMEDLRKRKIQAATEPQVA